MEIIQIPLAKMATFCYVAADKISNTCALIDPAFEIEKILGAVKERGLTVTHLINTKELWSGVVRQTATAQFRGVDLQMGDYFGGCSE